MYKVLIADDEKIIRIALKSMISWEDLGFSADYSAEDGLSAFETVQAQNPDLVIIDIMMPRMNGIEFVKKVRQNGYTGEIIILSNHQNFQYAVEALRNRVSDYLMKTDLTPQTLTQCLLKIKERLDSTSPAADRSPAPETALKETDVLRLKNALEPGALPDSTPLSDSYVFFGVFTRNSLTGGTAENNMASNALKNLIEEHLHNSSYQLIKVSENAILILAPRQTVNTMPDTAAFTRKIRRLVRLYLNTDCGFILSGLFSTCSQFAEKASLLPQIAQLVLYRGFGVIIDEDEYSSCLDKAPDPIPPLRRLQHYIDCDDFSGCRAALIRILEELKTDNYLPARTISLLGKIFDFLLLYETVRLTPEQDQLPALRRDFSGCCTLTEYQDCFFRLFDLIASSALSQKISGSSCRREILLICDYIRQNMDQRITLSMLAESVNMSRNYISRLFKSETGYNLVNYINQLKMNHARHLLEDKNLSVHDIALALGFDEPSYFNKIFFRFFGLSPTGYRKAVTEIISR